MQRLWQWAIRRSPRRRGVRELPAEELARWLAEGRVVQVVDIRDAAAFREGRLPGARHLPLARLQEEARSLDRSLATVVY